MIVTVLTAIVALALIGSLVVVAVLGWGGSLPKWERAGLCVATSGLVMAIPGRFYGFAPGIADLMFMSGLLLYVVARFARRIALKSGPQIIRRSNLSPRVARW